MVRSMDLVEGSAGENAHFCALHSVDTCIPP